MQQSFFAPQSRFRFLAFLSLIGLLGGGASFALGSPDNRIPLSGIPAQVDFHSGLMASPSAQYQVATSQGKTIVTMTRGGLLVKSQGQKYDVITSEGTVSLSSGEAIVYAGKTRMKIEVLEGQASVNSPYLVTGSAEVMSPMTLAAGETAEGSLLGPDEEAVLSNLGMHERSESLTDREMHEAPEPLGELAMAEFGTVITSLGLSEAAAASLAAPIIGGTAAAAGLAAVANSLNSGGTDVPPPISQ